MLFTLLCFFYISSGYSLTIESTYLYKDLQSANSTLFEQELASWSRFGSNSPYYYICNSLPILGGYGIGGSTFSRTYNSLPTHTVFVLDLKIYILDYWQTSDSIQITVDGRTTTLDQIGGSGMSSPYSTNLCGSSFARDMGIVHFRTMYTHTASSITIQLTSSVTYGNTMESWGIRDLVLRLYTSGSSYNTACFTSGLGYTVPNDCYCGLNQYFGSGCQTCAAGCQGCVFSTSNCIYCASGYYFDGSNCQSCPSNCASCSGTGTCISCSPGYFLLSNGTCSASCPSPMLNTTSPIAKCYSPCNSSEYLYWDSTCLSTCDSPLVTSTFSGEKICSYGCLTTEKLYWDGSCNTSCPSPYSTTSLKSRNFCEFPCSSPTNYLYFSNTSCLSSCSSPYSNSTYKSKLLCIDPCASGYFYFANDTCGSICPTPYANITIGSVNYCNSPCNLTAYLYDDSSCRITCPSPFENISSGMINYCSCPAGNPYYLSYNETCVSTCSGHFSNSVSNGMKVCIQSCAGYLMANGSCVDSCTGAFEIRTEDGLNYCDFKCPTGQFYNYDETCITTCSGIYISSSFNLESYCNPPCSQAEYISDNGTCYDSCPSPLLSLTNFNYKFCRNPCTDPSLPYSIQNGSCVATCNSPWLINSSYIYPVCDTPCNVNEYMSPQGNCTTSCNSPSYSINTMNYKYCHYVPDTPIITPEPLPNPDPEPSECSEGTPYLKFDTLTCVSTCNPPYINDTNATVLTCKFMEAVPTTATAVAGATSTATTATASIQSTVGAASGGGLSAFGLVTINRFLYYTRYLQINYPDNLREYYIAANNTAYPNLGITIPSDWIEFPPYKPIPPAFEGWGLQSSFIANYWSTLTNILVALVFGFILWGIKVICQKSKKMTLAFFFEKLMYIFKWNFALILFCTGYDSIVLYATCEFRTYSFDCGIGIFSFFLAIVCIILAIYFLGLTLWLAKLQYQVKKIKRVISSMGNLETINSLEDMNPMKVFMRSWQGFQILFTGYKDNTFFARGFIFIFMLRNILWILTLAILYEHPLTQIIIMCLLSYFMLIMMLIKRPFVNLVSKFEIPCIEAISAFVNTNILALAIMDKAGIEDPDTRTKIGSLVIYGFIIFGLVAFVCMAAYFALGFYIGIKKYRELRAAGSLTFISLFTIPFVSYGMDFDEFETNIKGDENQRVMIQRDKYTKEFSIVKKKVFKPLHRLSRKIAPEDIFNSPRNSVSNNSARGFIRNNNHLDSFHKTIIFKGLQARIKTNQIYPDPVDLQSSEENTHEDNPISPKIVVINSGEIDSPTSNDIQQDKTTSPSSLKENEVENVIPTHNTNHESPNLIIPSKLNLENHHETSYSYREHSHVSPKNLLNVDTPNHIRDGTPRMLLIESGGSGYNTPKGNWRDSVKIITPRNGISQFWHQSTVGTPKLDRSREENNTPDSDKPVKLEYVCEEDL